MEQEPTKGAAEHEHPPAGLPDATAEPAQRRRFGPRTRVAILVMALLVGALFLLDWVTESPRLCGSCHEMGVRTESWARSSHAAVGCVQCHTPARPWYARPMSVYDRFRLLGRDTVRHVRGGYADPVDGPVEGTVPMTDEICLQCHSVNRQATSGFRIKIDHVEHAKRNGSCVSCHVRTAHPLEGRSRPLTLMTQCFNCHGSQPDSVASGACILCHPADYELVPISHKPPDAWLQQHAPAAKTDREQCSMCHEQRACDNCHGLEMPHPSGWTKGEGGHAEWAARDRVVCERCHTQRPDLCSMCHHQSYQPSRGTWVQQHHFEVEAQGSGYCFECHEGESYCVRCHVTWATEGGLPPE